MTQQEYVIEQMAKENARLTIELHKANFTIFALKEQIEEIDNKASNADAE